MVDAVTPSSSARFVIENRTGEAADLGYVDRETARPCRLRIAAGEAGALAGDPAELRWLNAPPAPSPFLSAAEVDALDAASGPGAAPWSGLVHRMENLSPAEGGHP